MIKKRLQNEHFFLWIFIAAIIAILVKFFIFDIVRISGQSMEPTLKDGQTVFVSKLAYGIEIPFKNTLLVQWKKIEVGDAVLFLNGTNMVVKRCVATEKIPLEFSSESEYSLIVGGKKSEGKSYFKIPLSQEQFDFLSQYSCVPDGMFLAIGDNYNSSIDSRDFGFVTNKNVAGKVLCR